MTWPPFQVRTGLGLKNDSPIEEERVALVAKWICSAARYKAGCNTRDGLERKTAR